MNKTQIIDQLANNKEVEKIVTKMSRSSKNPFDCLDDLVQDIYVILLSKPDSLIEGLYSRGELGFYVLTIVKNQLLSDHSPYHYKYIRLRSQSDDVSKAETYKLGED